MKLLTKQLKTFDSVAGSMPQNRILPILSYLKFEDGYITKNNLESFVIMEADFKGRCLIDEKILMSFVNSTNADEIDVKVDGTSIILSHGKEKMVSPTDDIINFPESKLSETEEIEIDSDVIRAIKTAANFTIERENTPYASCVFLGKGLVAATTGFVAYTEKAPDSIPEIILEKNAISVIKNFTTISFSQSDSYQFFTNHIFKFGFIKKDTKHINMLPFSKVPEEEKVLVDKKEIIKFCDACVSSCQSPVITANIKMDKLIMEDAAYGIKYEKPISVILKDFSFNPALMGKLLKSVPDEQVYFIRGDKKYYVTGASGFVSLIMEIQQF
jgi:hypothetical protein